MQTRENTIKLIFLKTRIFIYLSFNVTEELQALSLEGSSGSRRLEDTVVLSSSLCSMLSCSQVLGGDKMATFQVQSSIKGISLSSHPSLSGHFLWKSRDVLIGPTSVIENPDPSL